MNMVLLPILLLSCATVLGQVAAPTFNPFNNGATPFYSLNQMTQQGYYNRQRPNNGLQNNFQQRGNAQTNTAPLFIRRFYLNNGYLYGRPSPLQPWGRRNLR